MSESNNLPTTEQDDGQMIQVAGADSDEVETKEIDVPGDAGTMEQITGRSEGERQLNSSVIHNHLADDIYDSDSAFVREFFQNSETACIRTCKLLIRYHEDYGEEYLTETVWIDDETGETIARGDSRQKILAEYDIADEQLRAIEQPRKLDDLVATARQIGYEPTIEVDVYHDERKVVWRDNGIGMTTYEVEEAFNVTGNTGVGHEADTGGAKGMGSLTFKNLTGKEGGMNVTTRTRMPVEEENVHPLDHNGITFYAYLGGWRETGDDVPDEFRGTEFSIPVQDGFSLGKMNKWVRQYTSGLRVPVLYQEHRDGRTTTKEEYGDVDFIEKYDTPPVVIDRPGEFTAVAGPDVNTSGSNTDDTWLISMPIERNSRHSLSSFWSVAIQFHDEQGKIIAGPNRGRYHKDGTVYETQNKETEVGSLHEDDVPLREPTADRDRLSRGTAYKRIQRYIGSEVKERELEEVAAVGRRMKQADHPVDVLRGDADSWRLFYKMLSYHGPYNVMSQRKKFADFLDNKAQFPDYDDETVSQIFNLFESVSVAPDGRRSGTKKRNRNSMKIGKMLAVIDPDEVYMAASTSGAFLDRKEVVENTYDTVRAVVVDGATKYEPLSKAYGFKKLKEVPREQSDDHGYDVSDNIHAKQQSSSSSVSSPDLPEATTLDEKRLKLRTSSHNQSIDYRKTIEWLRERFDGSKGVLDEQRYLVLFPRGGANISDHYSMAKYAAIASCSKTELEAIHDASRVFTYEEFMEQARSTVIATEEGGYTVDDLLELTTDENRVVVLADGTRKKNKRLLAEDNHTATRLRQMFIDDVIQQTSVWGNDDLDPEEKEPLFAVADSKTLERAAPAFRDIENPRDNKIIGLKFGYHSPGKTWFNWTQLDERKATYEQKAETPSWDNESPIYDLMPNDTDSMKWQLYMGFHDVGVDPTDLEPDQLRELVGAIDITDADIDWQEVGDTDT